MLTVTLPVENGQVRGRPIAVGSGDAAFSPVNVANAVVATESGSKSNDVDTIGTNTHATSMIGAELECAKEEANAISEIGSESECATEEAKVSSDETSSADEVCSFLMFQHPSQHFYCMPSCTHSVNVLRTMQRTPRDAQDVGF